MKVLAPSVGGGGGGGICWRPTLGAFALYQKVGHERRYYENRCIFFFLLPGGKGKASIFKMFIFDVLSF